MQLVVGFSLLSPCHPGTTVVTKSIDSSLVSPSWQQAFYWIEISVHG